MNGIKYVLDTCASIYLLDVEQEAIRIRRATKIKLPDCIVAATAIVLDAILLTATLICLN